MVDGDAVAVKFAAFGELVLLFALLLGARVISVGILMMVIAASVFRLALVRGDDGVGVAGHKWRLFCGASVMLMVMWVLLVDHTRRFDANTVAEFLAVGGFFVILVLRR